ncbi:quinone oxidoreductase family protein [Streptacidiphilus cavernicola]|uniref:Zinc-binding alcohol dehydrogenase family protein n=1 Tax=Streptacidiphilus cavernicola TaxID=3342716 RepID=A0ABV6W546_9ACTN
MPRVVVARDYGEADVLDVVEVPATPIGTGEARVRIMAAGVNPIDWKQYAPAFYGGDRGRLPLRLGSEAAGVVVEAAYGAAGPAGPVRVGDEVIVFSVGGAYASEVTVSAAALLPKPPEMTWEQAASLMLAGTTAMHAVVASRLRKGETLLVHAAAGGVGQMLCQIAAAWDVKVIGTARERDHEMLRGWGVEAVTFGDGLADRVRAAAPGGVDAAIDLVGTREAIEVSTGCLRDSNRLLSTVHNDVTSDLGVRVIGGTGPDHGSDIRMAARLDLVALVERGQLQVSVTQTFALDEVADAHRKSRSGSAQGKLVLLS